MIPTIASNAGLAGALVLAALTVAASWMVTRWVLAYLRHRAVLDHPNERSSHSAPTPRGGGIAILAVALPLVGLVYALHVPQAGAAMVVLGCAAALGLVSWLDDLRGLPVILRFAAHIAAVAVALTAMDDKLLVFQGALPLALAATEVASITTGRRFVCSAAKKKAVDTPTIPPPATTTVGEEGDTEQCASAIVDRRLLARVRVALIIIRVSLVTRHASRVTRHSDALVVPSARGNEAMRYPETCRD